MHGVVITNVLWRTRWQHFSPLPHAVERLSPTVGQHHHAFLLVWRRTPPSCLSVHTPEYIWCKWHTTCIPSLIPITNTISVVISLVVASSSSSSSSGRYIMVDLCTSGHVRLPKPVLPPHATLEDSHRFFKFWIFGHPEVLLSKQPCHVGCETLIWNICCEGFWHRFFLRQKESIIPSFNECSHGQVQGTRHLKTQAPVDQLCHVVPVVCLMYLVFTCPAQGRKLHSWAHLVSLRAHAACKMPLTNPVMSIQRKRLGELPLFAESLARR